MAGMKKLTSPLCWLFCWLLNLSHFGQQIMLKVKVNVLRGGNVTTGN